MVNCWGHALPWTAVSGQRLFRSKWQVGAAQLVHGHSTVEFRDLSESCRIAPYHLYPAVELVAVEAAAGQIVGRLAWCEFFRVVVLNVYALPVGRVI